VQEQRADARIVEATNRGVGVFRCRIVVAPVDQGGRAVVDLVQGSHKIGDVDILGPEQRGEAAMHRLHVFGDCPVCCKSSQPGLPGMQMAVDQARQQQHSRSIDRFRFIGGNARRHRDNAILLDKDVAVWQISDRCVHAQDGRALDQLATHLRSFVPGALTAAHLDRDKLCIIAMITGAPEGGQ
jgi:hypothetical protein